VAQQGDGEGHGGAAALVKGPQLLGVTQRHEEVVVERRAVFDEPPAVPPPPEVLLAEARELPRRHRPAGQREGDGVDAEGPDAVTALESVRLAAVTLPAPDDVTGDLLDGCREVDADYVHAGKLVR